MFCWLLFGALFAFTFAERRYIFGDIQDFVVKFKPDSKVIGTTCVDNYSYFRGYCYRLSFAATSDPNFADEACENDGGHLASIHSDEENAFIRGIDIYWDGAWIGMKKDREDFIWTWSDGTEVDYKHWTETPTNENDPANYAKIQQDGFWNYESRDKELKFICKKPAV